MDSKLQIISGVFRGRKLNLPVGARPTQNMARIALFNMLMSLGVRPHVVWDAFAGSGAFGIECLSRWPECRALFTDVNPVTVKKNLEQFALGARATAYAADAMSRISEFGAVADLIFIDPPYSDAVLGRAFMRRAAAVVAAGAIVVWEQDTPDFTLPDDEKWETLRDKKYGRARFLILRRK